VTAVPDVLVVGAGPTRLTLALQVHDHGAAVRIVERRPEQFRRSRAFLAHPRSLEVLRPLGVTAELLARSPATGTACLHLGSRTVPVGTGGLELAGTPFPPLTLLRQMDVEQVLAGALAERGARVERGTELIGLAEDGGAARATLRSAAGVEQVTVPAVAGCDGVDSAVRRSAGIGWPGGNYRREVVLADADLDGDLAPGIAHLVPGRGGLVFAFPLGEEGAAWRLLATRPVRGPSHPPGRDGPSLTPEELQGLLDDAGLGARITRTVWSTRVLLQHRLATRYRRGPVFLAGDAAHASSPAGGQGMNTGIQDAANLGWKLAFARSSTDPDRLLGSYEQERRPVAQQTLALTHLLFWAESSTDPVAALLRGVLAPLTAPLIPALLRRRTLTGAGLRRLSGVRIHYRGSLLSVDAAAGGARGLRAGDRLPDLPVLRDGRDARLHDLLAVPGVHLLLAAGGPVATGTSPRVHAHRLTGPLGAAVLAVRPDGYVGFRGGPADSDRLRYWLALSGAAAPADNGEGRNGPPASPAGLPFRR
jgi:2-polyprenyl-6-methoxyphenol hydroxylase-like FAD-dependent oxidoreductase